MNMDFMNSPFVVPVAGCMVGIVAIIAGIWLQAQKRSLKAQERIAMISRGLPLQEIERLMGSVDDSGRNRDPLRGLGSARRAGIVLVSVGVGLSLFFVILSAVLSERDVLSGAAIGIVPIAIGIGFFIDYNLQKRELARFGLDLGDDPASHRAA
jgi:hypothetical protein